MNFRDAASLMRFRDAAAPPIAHPFPSPPMEPTAFACDGCGLGTVSLRVHQRPNGDQHWLCTGCSARAYGSAPLVRVTARDCASPPPDEAVGPLVRAAEEAVGHALGKVLADCVEQVARDREAYAGGPRVVGEPAAASLPQPAGSPA